MIRRRQFLQFGPAALGGALATNWNSAVAGLGLFETYVLGRGIFDRRYTESRSFGRVLAAHGMRTTALESDVAKLWYGDLREQLRRAPAPFAGLTDRTGLFCLEELARDVDMRVMTRIDHHIDQNGSVMHEAANSTPAAEVLQHLAPGESFGHVAARIAMRHESHNTHGSNAQKRSGPMAPTGTTTLVTWVIA